MKLSRRDAIRYSAGIVLPSLPFLLGCRREGGAADASAPPPPVVTSGPAPGPVQCSATHAQIEGPYYRAGAPEKWDLFEKGMKGQVLEIDGRVTALDCAAGLRDVELDVWQATADGHYDNDGTMGLPPSRMLLRGKLHTDASGRYHVRTVVPGRYLNGAQYRPSHVHVKLRAAGFQELTTQLYFPGDPYNDIDPFIHKSLIMNASMSEAVMKARFDFALRRAQEG